jgi:hypothetical protein
MVIESATFQLTIDPDAAWEMAPEEEEAQRRSNADAMTKFFERLGEGIMEERKQKGEPVDDTPPEWEEDDAPLSEEEAEKMQADSDRLADRINARLAREGEENYDKILDEELDRQTRERGQKPLTPEEEAKRAEWIDEMNRAAEEALNNPDPELEKEMAQKHPLATRAFELSLRLAHEPEQRGWVPEDASEEHPVVELISKTMSASAKLAGSLNGYTWPPKPNVCATHLVRLKRARGYLDDALRAAEACAEEKLTDATWLAQVQRELNDVTAECDRLIEELRAKLEQGFD